MSLIGSPLPSATYAGSGFGYYAPRDAAGQLVGVTNLNGYIGQVAVTGDASITVTAPGLGAVEVSTAGNPQVPSSVACTGAMSAATLVVPGVCNLGGTNVAGLSSTGNVALTGTASLTAAGSVSAATFVNNTAAPPVAIGYAQTTNVSLTFVQVGGQTYSITAAMLASLVNYKLLRLTITVYQGANATAGGQFMEVGLTACDPAAIGSGDPGQTAQGMSVIHFKNGVASAYIGNFSNNGTNAGTFSVDLPYTVATWPATGLSAYFLQSAGGANTTLTGTISGVL